MPTTTKKMTLAQPIAPEDLAPGVYVSVLYEIEERFPIVMSCDTPVTPPSLVTYPSIARWSAGPVRVVGVCLPFVLVEFDCGMKQQLDVRRARLARVSRAYARALFREESKDEGSRKKRKRN